jgi:cytochrome c oxidase subunit II
MPLRRGRLVAALLASFLPSCAGVQSALDPAGPHADIIGRIGWATMAGGAAILLVVCALTAWAILAPARSRRWLAGRVTVVWGGLVFPIVLLSAVLVYGLALGARLIAPPAEAPLRVAVTGERWWWRVHYLGADGAPALVTANEIRIPTDRPVEFILTTADLIHSFWAPSLGGKLDMIPGRENRLILEASRRGIYRGQCAEFCGAQHALMAFDVVAEQPEEFDLWLAGQIKPAASPADDLLAHGQTVFLESGCGACHTIRGIQAAGTIGPDLTHVGGRRTLAAGTLANNREALASWITHAQEIKPGVFMPSFRILSPEDLDALAAYLESLK